MESTGTNDGVARTCSNPIIGLDVAGKLYYCRTSTLLGANGASPSYFDGRFGPDRIMDPDLEYIDERGREVYFIDRKPALFEIVLEYLRTRDFPTEIGNFKENRYLWRALRKEADFFNLDVLASLLQITFTCTPTAKDGKGILHWLGTNQGKDQYINPYTRGIVDVFFNEDKPTTIQQRIEKGYDPWFTKVAYRAQSVQFKPTCNAADSGRLLFGGDYVCVDFRNVVVRPTHFSLRRIFSYSFLAWNFEASADAKNWVVLHKAENNFDLCTALPGSEINNLEDLRKSVRDERARMELLLEEHGKESMETKTDYVERHQRHTCELQDTSCIEFFRYFRIIVKDDEDTEFYVYVNGLEIYGDVLEN